jgi:hypothetical protein
MHSCGAIDPEVGVMRLNVTLAAAIMSAIALTTAWSISMLPRARDVMAAIQPQVSSSSMQLHEVPGNDAHHR